MAKTFQCLPSELIHIEDPLDAFRFDRAVWTFGTALTAELNNCKGKTDKEIERKQERILRKWIPESAGPEKFAEPPLKGTQLP